MEDNSISEDAPLDENKMLAAMRFVRQYIKANGGNPYAIRWDEKPKYLPPEVDKAWEDYCDFWKGVKERNIIP